MVYAVTFNQLTSYLVAAALCLEQQLVQLVLAQVGFQYHNGSAGDQQGRSQLNRMGLTAGSIGQYLALCLAMFDAFFQRGVTPQQPTKPICSFFALIVLPSPTTMPK